MLKVAGGIMAGMSMTAEHKKKLSEAALNRSDEVKAKRAFARRRRYIMTSPEGEQFEILGLVEFCSQHNLSVSNLCTVASGRLVHYKGWKCQKIS